MATLYSRRPRTSGPPAGVRFPLTPVNPDENAADLACVAAYRSGDALAMDVVYRRYLPRIRAVCARYLGNGQLADDIVQEAFYNLLRGLDRVRLEEGFNFSAWIHRIAVNLCLDEIRRRERGASAVTPATTATEEAVLRVPDADRYRSPQEALEIQQLRTLVWEIARKLPERQRTVLVLRELQGLSYSAIAVVMEITESAVETLLHRARRRFKEAYLAVEGSAQDLTTGDCATAAYLLRNVRAGGLRREQKRFLVAHVADCGRCRRQFPERIAAIRAALATAAPRGAAPAAGAAPAS